MSFDLCQVRTAQTPYYIENISTSIYSLEELCWYFYNNMYLIDETIVNEKLCIWIRDELGQKKLYRQMMEHLERKDGTAYFIVPVFREIGYLSADELRLYQEKMSRLEVQPGDSRQKLKADSFLNSGMYASAISEYYQILERKSPANTGAAFYSGVWNNLGCAFARQFMFEDAANCFYKAWKLVRTKEALRKYVSVLPLFMDEKEYREKLKELGADEHLAEVIQEYNLKIAQSARDESERLLREHPQSDVFLNELKESYRRGQLRTVKA